MIKLAKEIGLSDEIIAKLSGINADCDLDKLAKCDDLTRLAICLNYAKEVTEKEYDNKGIPREIFIDTMKDIALWCENNGGNGLRNYKWILNHLKCELFRIGRLQFQLCKSENDTLEYDFLPFDFGDNIVCVHIPQGERLDYTECLKSITKAKLFLLSYFPEFEYEYYFCESWLLYRENQLFMKPDSNILQFQLLFDIVFSVPDDRQAIERIFGKRRLIKALYPENTSLQLSAKRFMQGGGKLGMGIGIINKNDIG